MNKGYGILENGYRFEVVTNNHYGTHYLDAIENGYDTFWDDRDNYELIGNSIVRRALNNGFIDSIHVEAPPTRPFTLRELVLPDNVKELFVNEFVTILEPIILPKSVEDVEVYQNVTIANLEDFVFNNDVSFLINNE